MPRRKPKRVTIKRLQESRRARKTAISLFGVKWGKMEDREIRELVCTALQQSPNKQLAIFADHGMLWDNRQKSLATIATAMGIGFLDIADEFQRIKKAEGLMRIHAGLPEIASQMVEAAKDKTYQCDADGCDKGLIEVPSRTPGETGVKKAYSICKKCHGTGFFTILGDSDRLKYVLESAKLVGQGGKIQVGVQVNNPQSNEKLEDLYSSVGNILEGKVGE